MHVVQVVHHILVLQTTYLILSVFGCVFAQSTTASVLFQVPFSFSDIFRCFHEPKRKTIIVQPSEFRAQGFRRQFLASGRASSYAFARHLVVAERLADTARMLELFHWKASCLTCRVWLNLDSMRSHEETSVASENCLKPLDTSLD